MSEVRLSSGKKLFIAGIILLYLVIAGSILFLVSGGVISKLPPEPVGPKLYESKENPNRDLASLVNVKEERMNLETAKIFFNNNLVREDGHVNLYYVPNGNTAFYEGWDYTNSEAASYYLLWNAYDKNKQAFDLELEYIRNNMIEPDYGYLMWRLGPDSKASGNDRNIATDADLRMLGALMVADSQWKDERYKKMIDELTDSLEEVAITENGHFAPYGGVRDGTLWKTEEVWLSYADFTVFRELADRRGQPWVNVYNNMKESVIMSQTTSGVYNTQIDANGNFHNTLDNGNYSINSLWVMVRAAESGDKDLRTSATKALSFYKDRYETDGKLYASYDINGNPATLDESTWVYALVGRAAIALGDEEFADKMVDRLVERQVNDPSSDLYGAFLEGPEDSLAASQFTIQESILTLQAYMNL